MSGRYKRSRVESAADRNILMATTLGPGEMVWNNPDKQLHFGDGETVGGVPVGSEYYTAPGTGAVRRRLGSKVADMGISPKDFGGVGDGVANDTAAVQGAINACLASSPARPLNIDARYRLTAPIKINRPVDTAYSSWHWFGNGDAAALFLDASGPMFTTDIAMTGTSPVVGEIVVHQILFEGRDQTTEAYVWGTAGQFVNITIDSCDFRYIAYLNYGGTFAQGHHFVGQCRAMQWLDSGFFFRSKGVYDVSVNGMRTKFGGRTGGGIFRWEGGGALGGPSFPVFRASITDCVFEGCGQILGAAGTNGFNFARNYCEFNYAPALNLALGDVGGANASVVDNLFSPAQPEIDNVNFYDVIWGVIARARSAGNRAMGKLHDTSRMTGNAMLVIVSDVAAGEVFKNYKTGPYSDGFGIGSGNVQFSDPFLGTVMVKSGVWDSLASGIMVSGTCHGPGTLVGGVRHPVRDARGPTNPSTDSSPYGGGSVGWGTGSYVRHSAPASGQPKGWICTAGGVPGTWVADTNL